MTSNYTIPMSDYYAQSKELEGRVRDTKQSVKHAFSNMVSSAVGEIDSRDLEYLENTDPYRKVKQLINKIEDHQENLVRMADENRTGNPMNPVIDEDRYYANRFKQLRDGELTKETEEAMSEIDRAVEFSRITDWVKQFSSHLSSDDASRILQLLKFNPAKALEKLYSNETFLESLQENDAVQDLFLNVMLYLEKGKYAPQKIVDAIFNNQHFLNSASKLPIKVQDGLVNTLIQFQQKANVVINKTSALTDWLKTLSSLKPINYVGKGISSLLKTKVGKTVTSPWFSVGVTGVVSAGKAYFDEEDAAHQDIGKAIVGGTIDAIASIGPINGALIGAGIGKYAGPKGAAILAGAGFVVGSFIQATNFAIPSWTTKVKDGAYTLIDKKREIGNSVSATFSWIKETAGNVMNKANETIDKMKDTVSNIIEKTETIGDFLSKTVNLVERSLVGF